MAVKDENSLASNEKIPARVALGGSKGQSVVSN